LQLSWHHQPSPIICNPKYMKVQTKVRKRYKGKGHEPNPQWTYGNLRLCKLKKSWPVLEINVFPADFAAIFHTLIFLQIVLPYQNPQENSIFPVVLHAVSIAWKFFRFSADFPARLFYFLYFKIKILYNFHVFHYFLYKLDIEYGSYNFKFMSYKSMFKWNIKLFLLIVINFIIKLCRKKMNWHTLLIDVNVCVKFICMCVSIYIYIYRYMSVYISSTLEFILIYIVDKIFLHKCSICMYDHII